MRTGSTSAGTGRRRGQFLPIRPADTIDLLGPRLIAEFAAAYQGDSIEPIVLDAAALEPAGRAAIDDPAGTVAEPVLSPTGSPN